MLIESPNPTSRPGLTDLEYPVTVLEVTQRAIAPNRPRNARHRACVRTGAPEEEGGIT